MKAFGRRSISASLAFAANAGWYVVAFVLAVTISLVLMGSTLGVHISPSGAPDVETGGKVTMAIPVSFDVDARIHPVVAPSLGIADAQIRNVRGSLRFSPRRGLFLAANIALAIAMMILALWMLSQLRAVFLTLRDGQPFVAANAVRLRRIAWIVIAGELARATVMFVENYYAMTHFSADGLRFDARPDVNVLAIIQGLIILVISEVFREGTRLDEEQSLTV